MALRLRDVRSRYPAAGGIGALLMGDAALPRDAFGYPYQVLFVFDRSFQPAGLVVDDAGRVLGYVNNEDGDPLLTEALCQVVPEPVQDAALRWWEGHRSSSL